MTYKKELLNENNLNIYWFNSNDSNNDNLIIWDLTKSTKIKIEQWLLNLEWDNPKKSIKSSILNFAAWITWVWKNALDIKKKINIVKKEISEFETKIEAETKKYNEWFIKKYISDVEKLLSNISNYSDEELKQILWSDEETQSLLIQISTISQSILKWESINTELEKRRNESISNHVNLTKEVKDLKEKLEQSGFIIWKIYEQLIYEWEDIDLVTRSVKFASVYLNNMITELNYIPYFYNSSLLFASEVNNNLEVKKIEYANLVEKYKKVNQNYQEFNFKILDEKIAKFNKGFYHTYKEKDILRLRILQSIGKNICSDLDKKIEKLRKIV